jgi:hypothetical protein
MNCKVGKAKGELPCTSCTLGQVTCISCSGSGRLVRWLEAVETARVDIQIEPDGQMTRAFTWGRDGTPASRAEIEADAHIR